MNQTMNDNNKHDMRWYSTVRGIAVVSGVFSLIVAGLLMQNYIADQRGLPEKEALYSAKLVQQKELLSQNPRSEEIKNELRGLDLELRQGYFQRKAFARRGKYLLLVSIAVFLLAMKKAISLKQALAMLEPEFRDQDIEAKSRMQARWAVGMLGIIIVGGILALAFTPGIELVSTPIDSGEDSTPPQPEYPTDEEYQNNWPIFRGHGGMGISTHSDAPTSWNGENGEGILWKTKTLLPGNNSPIVWGDRIFISGANETEKVVYCYSTDSGELLWQERVETPQSTAAKDDLQIFEDTGYAASTMACDGSRVYAVFIDGDIACFDLEGRRVWVKNLGIPDSIYGYATSLVVYNTLVLVQYDQGEADDDKSALFALEGKTGQIVWRKQRPVANTWTSPILIDTGAGKQFVTCSEPWVIAYDPDTGDELWKAQLMGVDLAPSPIYANGLVFVIQPNETLFAIRPDGRGDVTETHVAWTVDCIAPDICSPVSNGKLIFLLTTPGVLTCYDATSGDMIWEHEMDDAFQSSPSIAGEWIYLLSEEGVTYRIKASDKYEEAESKSYLDEWLKASPAFMDGRIFIRGDMHLYGIGEK